MVEVSIPVNVESSLGDLVTAMNGISDPETRERVIKQINDLGIALSESGVIPSAEKMELETIDDLIAMMVGAGAVERIIPAIYHFGENGTDYYLIWIVIHDVYDRRGVPVVVYTKGNGNGKKYIVYETDTGNINFAEQKSGRTLDFTIRIVGVKQLPKFLKIN